MTRRICLARVGLLRRQSRCVQRVVERPGRRNPVEQRPIHDAIHLAAARSHPGPRLGVVTGFLRWIYVDTPDHLVTVEDRVGEPFMVDEVPCVHLEIGEVRFECHLCRPVAPVIETRCRSEVVEARHPRFVVPLVVLGSERFELKPRTLEPGRDHELIWNERFCHASKSTDEPSQAAARRSEQAELVGRHLLHCDSRCLHER